MDAITDEIADTDLVGSGCGKCKEETKIFGNMTANSILHASGLKKIHTIDNYKYKTIPEIFIKSCKDFKNKQCIGYREILKKKIIDKNIKYKLGKYNWITYEQLFHISKSFGCGIRNRCKLNQKSKIVIYASTKKEWFIAANGCLLQNYTIVTCYSNLGIDVLVYCLNKTKSKLIIIDEDQKECIMKIKDRCKYLKYLIIIKNNDEDIDYIDQNSVGLKCYMFNEIIENGEDSNIISLPGKDNIAFIIFTSGSSGEPKGVKIKHSNMVVSINGIKERLMINDNDTYLAHLPMVHVLELLAEYVCLSVGARVGYGTPTTLTDTSTKIMKNTRGDINKLNPTIIAFVPIILDKIKESIINKIKKSPSYVRKLYDNIYEKKKKYLDTNKSFENYNSNNGILNIINKSLGTNLKSILSAGASLSVATKDFFYICFDINILQGYGLTETCGSGCISSVDQYNHNTVGAPLVHNYIKLIDWCDGEYYAKDNVGEICIGGNNVSSGYYKNREETLKNYFTMNNIIWFRTGDIGKIHHNGTLEIIDRKENIVKVSTGEYISYVKIENIINESMYVSNCMCVVNNKYSKQPLCVVSVNNNNNTVEEISKDDNISSIIIKDIKEICDNHHLKKCEIPCEFKISHMEWNVDNDLLTPSLVKKRMNIIKFYGV
jgi:long-chain acyl-CoA synthetase